MGRKLKGIKKKKRDLFGMSLRSTKGQWNFSDGQVKETAWTILSSVQQHKTLQENLLSETTDPRKSMLRYATRPIHGGSEWYYGVDSRKQF